MEKYKYTTIFSSTLRPLVSEEKDKYLAMASLIDVGDFVPDVDVSKNIDLLPIAFNAAVVNRVNKNGDVIDAGTALEIYKSFINKPINIEHNRQRVIGTILTAGFSEFGTDKPLPEETASDNAGPFNITLGGVVWKVVNSELADIIEESADPASDHYLGVSASWELGFTDYNIIIMSSDDRNIENAEIISDTAKIETLKDNLKSFGGDGTLGGDQFVYRQVINEVVPLGIGLTESPAADVKGVAVKNKSKENRNENGLKNPEKKLKEKPKKTNDEDGKKKGYACSDSSEASKNVNKIEDNIMKVEKLSDITEEAMQTLTASAITSFVEEELQKAAEHFAEERDGHKRAIDEAKEKFDALEKDSLVLKEENEKIKVTLDELEADKAAKKAEETFNHRMSYLDEEYNLSDEDRNVLSADIKEMSKEDFEAYSSKMAILLSAKNRKAIEDKAKEETKAEEAKVENSVSTKEKVLKAESDMEEQASEVVDEAVDQAEVEAADIPNSTDTSEPDVYSKYRKAFQMDQFTISR